MEKRLVIFGLICVFLFVFLFITMGILANIVAQQTREIRGLQQKVEKVLPQSL
ncbi:hypothetical protein LW135_03440 [Helicobacter sp. faydin-H20]|uniref:hypothetical protein n=1 Tax=Helicobacter anatolicus TaxID=2905874 RepID=UPI001E3E35B2|nr:hypothetical protein [Helicobacter anatolicus]MCE3036884.1 hypothetical protein [Helicobacter anatolicus]